MTGGGGGIKFGDVGISEFDETGPFERVRNTRPAADPIEAAHRIGEIVMASTADKCRVFRQLHESGCFVIPNPWDVGSARYLQRSASRRWRRPAPAPPGPWATPTAGRRATRCWRTSREIVAATDLPVNADFEGALRTRTVRRRRGRAPVHRNRRRRPLGRGLHQRPREPALSVRPGGGARARRARGDRQERRRRAAGRPRRRLHPQPCRTSTR